MKTVIFTMLLFFVLLARAQCFDSQNNNCDTKSLNGCLDNLVASEPAGKVARIGNSLVLLKSDNSIQVYSKRSVVVKSSSCQVQSESLDDVVIELLKIKLYEVEMQSDSHDSEKSIKAYKKLIDICSSALPGVAANRDQLLGSYSGKKATDSVVDKPAMK